MEIQWTTPATEQLVCAYEYVLEENPAAAERILNHIWEAVEILQRHPRAGRKGRVPGTRELVISGPPFIVGYRMEKNHVWIFAVWHEARKWPREI